MYPNPMNNKMKHVYGWKKEQTLDIKSYSQLMIGVSNHLLRKVFWFDCHSQKVFGSLGKMKQSALQKVACDICFWAQLVPLAWCGAATSSNMTAV